MLFKRAFLDGVVDGRYDRAFRRWDRARVRRGTRMRTAVGVLEVTDVDVVPFTKISDATARRAGDLAAFFGLEKRPFKTSVRKLKELGLTESLEVGYRLSPRGRALLKRLRE